MWLLGLILSEKICYAEFIQNRLIVVHRANDDPQYLKFGAYYP